MRASNQELHPDAAVAYVLHASIEYREAEALKTVKATRQVHFLPYTEVQPPTDTASFPGEFITHVTLPVWKHTLGGHVGTIAMKIREPPPLAYPSAASCNSTNCILSLTVNAHPQTIQRLRTMSLDVKAAIRVKTFYSADSVPCIPKQTLLTARGVLRLHDEVLKLEEQKFQSLEWNYDPKIVDKEGPPAYESLMDQDDHSSVGSSSKDSSAVAGLWSWLSGSLEATDQNTDGGWHASVHISIAPSQTLLPTFCSKLIARQYSLLLRVAVGGVHVKKADFEVPLQVVHLRPTGQANMGLRLSENSTSCLGIAALLDQHDV